MIISPSILSADFANLEKEVNNVVKYGVEWIHIDVMDGHFVPNITIGAPVVKSLRKITKAKLDAHLMIDDPKKYIDDFINAGADIITVHFESKTFDKNLLTYIKSKGKKAGLSIKPKTPFKEIVPYLDTLDLVLIMTVEPGFSGQKFMEEAALKIKEASYWAKEHNPNLIIQVDGGINAETSKICKNYGANCLVAGNFIYKNSDIKKAIEDLKM